MNDACSPTEAQARRQTTYTTVGNIGNQTAFLTPNKHDQTRSYAAVNDSNGPPRIMVNSRGAYPAPGYAYPGTVAIVERPGVGNYTISAR
jgi:hypothetical protein